LLYSFQTSLNSAGSRSPGALRQPARSTSNHRRPPRRVWNLDADHELADEPGRNGRCGCVRSSLSLAEWSAS